MESQPKSWAARVGGWIGIGSLASLVIVIAGASKVSEFIQANRAALLLWWRIECGILVLGASIMSAVMVWNYWLQGSNALQRRRYERNVRHWWNTLPDGAGRLMIQGVLWKLPPADTFFAGPIESGVPVCPEHETEVDERAGVQGLRCQTDGAQLTDRSRALVRETAINALQASRRKACGERRLKS